MYVERGPPRAENSPLTHRSHRPHRIYVCACMFVGQHACLIVIVNVIVHVCVYFYVYVYMYVTVYVDVYVSVYVYVYVYMYVYVCMCIVCVRHGVC